MERFITISIKEYCHKNGFVMLLGKRLWIYSFIGFISGLFICTNAYGQIIKEPGTRIDSTLKQATIDLSPDTTIKKNAAKTKMIKADQQEFISFRTSSDILPQYPGGETALRKYIKESIRYPKQSPDAPVDTKIYVEFTVAADGSITQLTTRNAMNPAFEAEALRIVRNMKGWKPGTSKGKPVDVRVSIPVEFTPNQNK